MALKIQRVSNRWYDSYNYMLCHVNLLFIYWNLSGTMSYLPLYYTPDLSLFIIIVSTEFLWFDVPKRIRRRRPRGQTVQHSAVFWQQCVRLVRLQQQVECGVGMSKTKQNKNCWTVLYLRIRSGYPCYVEHSIGIKSGSIWAAQASSKLTSLEEALEAFRLALTLAVIQFVLSLGIKQLCMNK